MKPLSSVTPNTSCYPDSIFCMKLLVYLPMLFLEFPYLGLSSASDKY